MDYQKKVDMEEVKEIQKQTTEIAKILKKDGYEDLYLIVNKPEGELFVVNLRTNLVYGPYTTMDDLYHDIGDEDDALVHAEVNVL